MNYRGTCPSFVSFTDTSSNPSNRPACARVLNKKFLIVSLSIKPDTVKAERVANVAQQTMLPNAKATPMPTAALAAVNRAAAVIVMGIPMALQRAQAAAVERIVESPY